MLTDTLAQLPDVSVHRNVPLGSRRTLDGLRLGEIDLGVATADVAYLAFSGQLDRTAPRFDQLRGLAVFGLEWFHLLVRKNSAANSLADLRGSTLGRSNDTGTAIVLELLMQASGIGPSDLKIEPLSTAEVDKRLIAGTLDAGFMNLNVVPPAEHAIAALQAGARFLEIEGSHVERLRLQHPFLIRTLIPRGTYPGQDAPVRTLGVDILLLCRADLDDSLVYRFMKVYFNVLARTNPATDLDRAAAMAIPLHPGAIRYYREREVSQ